jgi:branched-chain amino acid transport system ATP-binding protein
MKGRELLKNPILWAAVVLGGLTLEAVWSGSGLSIVTEIAIYVLYGAGLNIMLGYTGLVPFGASVFFGTASYAAAIAIQRLVGNEIEAVVFAVMFSACIGLILGAIVLLRRGLYFSLLTLACSQIAFEIAFKWTGLTGGENGLQNVSRVLLVDPIAFHLFCLAVVLLTLWAIWRFGHSPMGRTFQAIRENEERARSLGYDVYRTKLWSFVLSGSVIGLAGGMLAFLVQGAYANNLSWQHAGDALLANVLGGVHHFLGPLWGAIAFILLQEKLSAIIENWWLLFAPIVIVLALFSPQGLHGLGQRLFSRQRDTLVRNVIPPRPGTIAPYRATRAAEGPTIPLLEVRKLSKNFGALVTAREIDLQIMSRGLHSLIGPNGAGKTTFFNMLTGVVAPSAGEIFFGGRNITRMSIHQRARLGLGRSFQIVRVFPRLSAFENARIAAQATSPKRRGVWTDAYGIDEINIRTWSLLSAVGLEDRAEILCINLSHGEQRLLEIAVTLATDAQILLFDEPLAGLAERDRRVVTELILGLAKSHSVFLVEHDIDRVLTISDRITVLHQGRVIADGKPAEISRNTEVIAAYLGKSHAAPATAIVRDRTPPPAGAECLLRVSQLQGGYEGSRVLNDLSLELRKGEVVALLGRNGVGKTTTLKAIMGGCDVQSGDITLDGERILRLPSFEINRRGIALVPQGRRLFPNLTVAENLMVAARPGGASLDEVYTLFPKLRAFQKSRAENLSGGERQMVAIARALVVPSRVILLDEPFEGLAPAIVDDIMTAIIELRSRASLLIVEHDAGAILQIADRAYIIVNGAVAYEGTAEALACDQALQAKHLGLALDA